MRLVVMCALPALFCALDGCDGVRDVVADLSPDVPPDALVDASSPDGANAGPERGVADDRTGSDADAEDASSDLGENEDAGTSDGAPIAATADLCLGDVAARVFQYALCTCADLQLTSTFNTDSYDSADGPLGPTILDDAPVGSNAGFQGVFLFTIGGDLSVAGTQGLSISTLATIFGDLRVAGPATFLAAATVFGDSWFAGDLDGAGSLYVTGNVTQASAAMRGALLALTVDGRDEREPVLSVSPPCPCGNDAVDLDALVTSGVAHAQNAELGFDASSLASIASEQTIELPAGWLAVPNSEVSETLHLKVTGKTALFVERDMNVKGSISLELGPDAELDLVIGGDFHFTAEDPFGSFERPAAVRVFVAGDQQIAFTPTGSFGGNLYAPRANFSMLGTQALSGSVIAKNAVIDASSMHYDRAILRAHDGCPPAR